MKKILIMLVVLFCFVSNVDAANQKVSCDYVANDGSEEKISVIVDTKENIEQPETVVNRGTVRVVLGNSITAITVDGQPPENYFYENELTVQEYFANYGTSACPPYFHITRDSTSATEYGFFSDKVPEDLIIKPRYSYKNISSGVENNGDGDIVPTEKVHACQLYSTDTNHIFQTEISINYTKKRIIFSKGFMNEEDLKKYVDSFDFELEGECPKDLMVCYNMSDDVVTRQYGITTEEIGPTGDTCYTLSETATEIIPGVNACLKYTKLMKTYDDNYSIKKYSEANKTKERILNFCDNIEKNHDYDSYEYSCIKLCLGKEKDFAKIEGINLNIVGCPISSNIIGFVYNILKWAKYIVPALVIILSMLDFIKAIVSQSEDDMKKAQGKFIKRLIAAALLFLGPLIINFMLTSFGLYSSKCDVFNLFS